MRALLSFVIVKLNVKVEYSIYSIIVYRIGWLMLNYSAGGTIYTEIRSGDRPEASVARW